MHRWQNRIWSAQSRRLLAGAWLAMLACALPAGAQNFDYQAKPRAGSPAYASPDPAPSYMQPNELVAPPPRKRRPTWFADYEEGPTLRSNTPPFAPDGRPLAGGFRVVSGIEPLPPASATYTAQTQPGTVLQPVPDPMFGGGTPAGEVSYGTAPYATDECVTPYLDGQVPEDDYCKPQQVGDVTFLEEWCQKTWLGNPTLWQNFNELSGVQGFKGPVDQGINGNFGFHKGVNWAIPAWNSIGLGYQLGAQISVSDLSGSSGPVNSTREQYFITSGFFRRANGNRGLQGGAVIDYLHDNFYIRLNLLQVRSELSYIYNCHEVGVWSAVHLRSNTMASPAFFAQQPTVTWQSNDQYNLFYRYTFCNGGSARTWIGLSGQADLIFGSDATAPLSERWAIQAVTNYLIPNAGSTIPAAVRESWGVTLSLIWYPGYRVPNACFNPYRPLFMVADNGSLFVRQK